MLTTSPLFAPDPALPARDAHLDPAWVAGRLTALLRSRGETADLRPHRLVRAKYRIGESLRVVHRLIADGEPVTMTARTFVGGGAERAARRSPEALHDAEHDTVWWRFPDDRRLRGTGAVMAADRELAEALDIRAWRSSSVAEYAPERSLTVRADDSLGVATGFVKLYAPGAVDTAELAERYRLFAGAFAATGDVSVPVVLGRAGDLLALAPMPGCSWTQVAPDDRVAVLARIGGAIARIHSLPTGPAEAAGLRSFGRLAPERVLRSAELVAVARPDVAAPLVALRDVLSEAPDDGERVVLHGDCHPGNSLVDGDRLAIIDVDQSGVGSPACDVASMIARLRHGVVVGETTRSEAATLEAAFLAGYAATRPLPAAPVLAWHVAAAIVAERAVRAVNRVHPRALARLDDLVDLARQSASALPGGPR